MAKVYLVVGGSSRYLSAGIEQLLVPPGDGLTIVQAATLFPTDVARATTMNVGHFDVGSTTISAVSLLYRMGATGLVARWRSKVAGPRPPGWNIWRTPP